MPQYIPDIASSQLHNGPINKGSTQGTMESKLRIFQIFVPFDTLAAARALVFADSQHDNS